MRMPSSSLFWVVASLLVSCSSHGEAPAGAQAPARVRVTNEVIQKELDPFGATIGGIGNSMFELGSGFEPVVFRLRLMPSEDAADRVVARPSDIAYADTLREGALDGAQVRVYRIENGRMALVREDQIAPAGFHASGWQIAHREHGVVPAGDTHYVHRWNDYNRPDATTYFTVRAIDSLGQLSDAAREVSQVRPRELSPAARESDVVDFKRARLSLPRAAPAAPNNLRGTLQKDGTLRLQWDRVDGAAGYVVYRSDDPPSAHRGFWMQLSNTPSSKREHVKKGDLVMVSKKLTRPLRSMHTDRVWNADNETTMVRPGLVDFFSDDDPSRTWELHPHDASTPVTEPGESFLRLTLSQSEPALIGRYNHGGTVQDWLTVLETKPYTVEVWLRQTGNAKVTFRLTGFFANEDRLVPPVDMTPGPEWKKYTATFTPPLLQTTDQPNQMVLEVTGPGVVDIDNFRVYRADTPFLDATAQEYEQLRQSKLGALRTHAFIKTGRRTYDMEQLTNPGGVINGTTRGNTLPQTLAVMKKAGVQPWLQIEPHMSPLEWLGFVEYMAAPYDSKKDTPLTKPWAYKRVSQGQVRPWVEEFDSVMFELGNETWNSLFYPWTFEGMVDAGTGQFHAPGSVYGMFQEHVIDVMRSSPYWTARVEAKLRFALGGWNGFDFGKDAAKASPRSSLMGIAAYNGGWDSGEGPVRLTPESFFHVLTEVSHAAIPSADRHAAEVQALRAQGHAQLRVGAYEAGPGYALDGLNGAHVTAQQKHEQEQVMKSLAAGTATLDAFLARAERGFTPQMFFMYAPGTFWSSHAPWFHGGHAYPSWAALSLFNREARGEMLRVEPLSLPTQDLKKFESRPAVKAAPMVAAYATRRGSRVHVIVLSRKFPGYPARDSDGFTPMTLELPFSAARSVTLHKLSGDPRAHNVTSEEVKVQTQSIPVTAFSSTFVLNEKTGADARGLPPASTFLYVFEL
jgi:hypothetical protein